MYFMVNNNSRIIIYASHVGWLYYYQQIIYKAISSLNSSHYADYVFVMPCVLH